MKHNGILTNIEQKLRPGQAVISKTDIHGKILYVNDEFCRISGFTQEEAVGMPHNLVRHPQMPSTIFAELWETISRKHSWTGVLVNRCKNGDHYWVEAIVSPIFAEDVFLGYMSVRTAASEKQIRDAEMAYGMIPKVEAGLTIISLRNFLERIGSKVLAILSLFSFGIGLWFGGFKNDWPIAVS